jgi:predicted nucleotidyltransferase
VAQQLNETLLYDMTNRLVQTFQPEQVILFGSYAWGNPNDISDIDLYVIVPESSERPLQRARRARTCIGDVRVALDILVRTRAEADKYRHLYASLECQIFEKGRVLYERN